MAGPKVVVIGAGSVFFTRQTVCGMIRSEALRDGTLVLVDIKPDVLDKMFRLGQMIVTESGSPLKLEATGDRCEALRGADFVIFAFSDRGVRFRGIDTQTSLKHGIRLSSGDTIGPGGVFRTLREVPTALAIARDIERLCPEAWVINYVNPTATIGTALQRHTKLKSFALCDGHYTPFTEQRLAARAGLADSPETCPDEVLAEMDTWIGGVNHYTWLLSFTYRGQDMLPPLRSRLADLAAKEDPPPLIKGHYDANFSLALMDAFGAYPTETSHSKEYVVFFQGKGVLPPPEKRPAIPIFDLDRRKRWVADIWQEIDALLQGRQPLEPVLRDTRTDKSVQIIETMWQGHGPEQLINVPNGGAVSNLPADAVLELPCQATMDGVRPRPFGKFPLGLAGLQHQVIDTHELSVEAAVNCDRALVRRAFATDPLTTSLDDADALIDDLFAQQQDALPAEWYA